MNTFFVIVLVYIGLIPLLNTLWNFKYYGWIYISFIILYMYLKSVFYVVHISGMQIQITTIEKDFVGLFLLFTWCYDVMANRRYYVLKNIREPFLNIIYFIIIIFIMNIILKSNLISIIIGLRPYIYFQIVGFIVGYYLINKTTDWLRYYNILYVSCLVISILSLIQAYIYPEFLVISSMKLVWGGEITKWLVYDEGRRLRGYFTSPNTLGYFMALGAIISVRYILKSDKKLIHLFFVMLFFWVLILTKSRSAFLGAVIAIIFEINYFREIRYKWGIIGITSVSILIIFFFSSYSKRFSDLLMNPRLVYWAGYIGLTVNKLSTFLIGYGVGSVGRFGADVVKSNVELGKLAEVIGGEGNAYAVDNAYIRTFYEMGIIGFIMYYYIILKILKLNTVYSIIKSKKDDVFNLSMAIILFIFLISFFSDSLITYPWNLILWVIIGGIYYKINRTLMKNIIVILCK